MPAEGKQDVATVTSDGERLQQPIQGVVLRLAVVQIDERGTLTEIYNPAWGVMDAPLVYVYQATVRPGIVKGWVEHRKQTDRLFFNDGTFKIVLYDNRPESPTHKRVNVYYLGAQKPGLVTIPAYVYHAVQNIGETHAGFINLPTRAYDHADPDKFRLPLDNDVIPYKFNL